MLKMDRAVSLQLLFPPDDSALVWREVSYLAASDPSARTAQRAAARATLIADMGASLPWGQTGLLDLQETTEPRAEGLLVRLIYLFRPLAGVEGVKYARREPAP